jgi:hypothetical protein
LDMQQALQCAAGDQSCATASSRATEGEDEPFLPYWKPTLDLSLVLDMPAFPRNHVPLIMGKVRVWGEAGRGVAILLLLCLVTQNRFRNPRVGF